MLKLFFVCVGLLFASYGKSQSLSERLLVKPAGGQPPIHKKVLINEPSNLSPFSSSSAKVENEEIQPDSLSKLSLSFNGAPNSQSYSLKGSGLNGTLSNEYGYEYGLKTSYHSDDESKAMFLSYDRSEATFKGSDFLTPSKIDVQREYLFAGYSNLAFFERKFGFKIGYGLINQKATQTEPNELISSYNSHGFLTGFMLRLPNFMGRWGVSSDCSVYLPSSINEDNGSSGNRGFSYTSILDVLMFRNLTADLQLTVGFRSKIDNQSYSGQSSRGTNNATTNYQTYSFPIELRYSL